MNIKLVFKLLGRILSMEAAVLVLPMAVALLYHESPMPFVWSILVILCISLPLSFLPAERHFHVREGFVSVGLLWLLTGVVGGLPFYFSGYFNSFIDCVFEASSGFTTTGSSVITDIEIVPRCIVFWRSFTHWIGGMGVLVFLLSLLPLAGGYHMNLMRAESPGPSCLLYTSPSPRDTR